MMAESVDSRILAAFRFLDGETTQPITTPLAVSGTGSRLIRNRRGLYVLSEAPGFADYTSRFDKPPSPEPAPTTLAFTVVDPSRRHLPRSFSVELPREVPEDPENPDDASKVVFLPVDVRMYPSPTARPLPGSATVRLSLKDAGGAPLARAVIRLKVTVPDGPTLQALGLSDERGEVLLILPGIPVISWGQEEEDALIETKFTATLEWAPAPIVAGLPAPDMPTPTFTLLPQTLQVASGLEIHRPITIPTS
jgi:hypothetical protein